MTGINPTFKRLAVMVAALILAALACSAPGAQQPDTAATVAAVYATITAQADLPPLTQTAIAASGASGGTPTPTATMQSGPTATAPDTRNPLIVIHTCPNAIDLDTRRGDWPDGVTALSISQVNYDPNKEWGGAADLSGTVRLCWTEWALYLMVEVTDDKHYQIVSYENSFKGDEVEVMFDYDLRGDFAKTEWDADDSQISLNPGEFGTQLPAPYRYRPQPGAVDGVSLDARRNFGDEGEGYFLEAEIAWVVFGGKPVNGQNYGLCIALSDADHEDQPPAQDSLLSTCPGMITSNPTTWQSATFVNP